MGKGRMRNGRVAIDGCDGVHKGGGYEEGVSKVGIDFDTPSLGCTPYIII